MKKLIQAFVLILSISTIAIGETNKTETTEVQDDAPKGYSWCEVPHVGVSVLKPDGWHVWEPEITDEGLYVFRICRDTPKDGEFHTGFTMNIIPKIKEKSKAEPSRYAAYFIQEKSQEGKVLEIFEMIELSHGMKRCGITIEKEMTIDGITQNYVDHHTLFANDKTGTLFVLIFGTPSDKWDEDSKICNAMSQVKLNIHL